MTNVQFSQRLAVFSIAAFLGGCFSGTPLNLGTGAKGGSNAADGGDGAQTSANKNESQDSGPDSVKTDAGASKSSGKIKTTSDKIDLLFVVDNSGSMREEQAGLKKEFPKLLTTLVTGMRDGQPYAQPVSDIHVGVVSVNMGLIGVQGIGGCSGATGIGASGFGDDGLLRHKPTTSTGCKPSYPPFLSFVQGKNDPTEVVNDFACIAMLGTDGCGFEQQMESGLKALWPSVDVDPATGKEMKPNRITFLTDMNHPELAFGHGDRENKGFLRKDSLLAVVVVTDEEDCSSKVTNHFVPQQYLNMSSEYYNQDLNLRCFYNKQELYPVERYVNGLQALRGSDDLVVFSAVVGVPQDLVDDTARKAVDFSNDASRNAYYNTILNDKRMQETIDSSRQPGNGNLLPTCVTPTGTAYPARRIVNIAKGFGKNGRVQSICFADFAAATETLLDMMAPHLPK